MITDETWTLSSPPPPAVRYVLRFVFFVQKDKARPRFIINCVMYTVIMLWVTVVCENGAENSGMGTLMCMTKVVKDDTQLWLTYSFKKATIRVCGKRRFMKSKLSEEFPQTSRTTLYRIVMDRLGYHKFCARWVPKQLTDFHKTQRMGSALMFLQRYWEKGDKFDRIMTGDETWVQFVNAQTKSSLNSGCTPILPTSPRYSNEHCRTKKWWPQYYGTIREFCWQN